MYYGVWDVEKFRVLQVPRPIYGGESNSFIILHPQNPDLPPDKNFWERDLSKDMKHVKNSELPPRLWDLEKFLHISFIFLHNILLFPLYFFIFSEALGYRKILSFRPIYELWYLEKSELSHPWT